MRRIVRAAVIAGLVWTTACLGCSGGAPRDDRGSVLASDLYEIVSHIDVAFSADGTEVFYTANRAGGGSFVRAVRVSDGVKRDVDAVMSEGGPLLPTADGTALYAVGCELIEAGICLSYHLREALSGTDLLLDAPSSLQQLVALSPSGRRLLGLRRSDGEVVVHDFDAATRTRVSCRFGPSTFSPQSDAVLCATTAGLSVFPLSGQQPYDVTIPSTAWVFAVSWTEQGIRAAFSEQLAGDAVVADATTGEVVAQLSPDAYSSFGGPMAFTRDGTALAYADSRCLAKQDLDCHAR